MKVVNVEAADKMTDEQIVAAVKKKGYQAEMPK